MNDLPEMFLEFWAIYPRRVAKQAAIRMYRKALKQTTSANLIAAARKYANERAGQDQAFTKHPSTWLNAGCWGDYEKQEIPTLDKQLAIGFYANFTSPELEAWETYGKATRGRGYPRDKNGGWYFPTRWPPELDLLEGAA